MPRALIIAFVLSCSACALHSERLMGPSPITDWAVRVFHAESATRWPDFRLGGGLNVVVVNPKLPRAPSWRAQAGDANHGISSSPVVYRNLLLVASNDNALYAFDAANGRLKWRYLSMDQLMTQPVYALGYAFVASGNANCTVCMPPYYVVAGSGSNRISAVDLSTGTEEWAQRLAGSGMPSPAIVGSNLVHADGAGVVLAIDAATGGYVWHRQLGSVFMMSSVVRGTGDAIYLSGSQPGAVYALRARDGSVQWSRSFMGYHTALGDAPMAISGNELVTEYLEAAKPKARQYRLLAPASPVLHHIAALDARTGSILWDRIVDSGDSQVRNQSAIPLIYRNRIYEGSAVTAVMSSLDLRTGRQRWQIRTRGAVKGGIVALDGVLYFGDLAGYLWAVRATDGRVIGRLRTNLHFNVGSPIVLNDSLIDGSQEGTVIALPLRAIRDGRD